MTTLNRDERRLLDVAEDYVRRAAQGVPTDLACGVLAERDALWARAENNATESSVEIVSSKVMERHHSSAIVAIEARARLAGTVAGRDLTRNDDAVLVAKMHRAGEDWHVGDLLVNGESIVQAFRRADGGAEFGPLSLRAEACLLRREQTEMVYVLENRSLEPLRLQWLSLKVGALREERTHPNLGWLEGGDTRTAWIRWRRGLTAASDLHGKAQAEDSTSRRVKGELKVRLRKSPSGGCR